MRHHVMNYDHETIDALLPWFVNGTLDDSERTAVEAHVADCSDCRQSLALLRNVAATVSRDAATPLVPPPRPGSLLAKIDAAESRSAIRRRVTVTAAIAAAGVAAVALIAAISSVVLDNDNPAPARYETATSDSQPGMIDYIVEVRFDDDVDDETRARVLREIAGPVPPVMVAGGSYRIVLSLDAATLAELERAVDAIEGRTGVGAARVVAVQLPVE